MPRKKIGRKTADMGESPEARKPLVVRERARDVQGPRRLPGGRAADTQEAEKGS